MDINNSSYNGELALPYIAPAILSADTIANGYITVHENVKHKAVLKKLVAANETSTKWCYSQLSCKSIRNFVSVTSALIGRLCKLDAL